MNKKKKYLLSFLIISLYVFILILAIYLTEKHVKEDEYFKKEAEELIEQLMNFKIERIEK